ncbi:lipocalin family protein [Pontibacter harenae]|uniref:lipocalin family protein n=1 Tax=Pontibacter harenae TaxID=2894083 RepID=UPI001E40CADC|nr:lipocalin family protein [Pontibacter harenae]MCC9168385.1 DUF4923 family protein [Pontibacter harenae]
MKLTTIRSLLFALSILSFLTSCEKDEEDSELSRTELLTAETWNGDRILIGGQDAADYPGAANLVPDPKSLRITFNTDGTFTGQYTQNGQTIPASGNWELSEDEQTITGDFFGLASEAEIETLTTSNLNLTTTVQLPNFPFPLPAELRLVR